MTKRIFSFIIIIVVAFSLGWAFTSYILPSINNNTSVDVYSEENSSESDFKTLYKKTLESYVDSEGAEYALTDIDKDGTPELVIRTGMSEADYMFYFYKINNKKAENIGTIGGGHVALYDMEESDKYILAIYAYMGYETVSNISIENNKINYEQVSHRELGEDEEYVEGGEVIELIDVNDLSAINEY